MTNQELQPHLVIKYAASSICWLLVVDS